MSRTVTLSITSVSILSLLLLSIGFTAGHLARRNPPEKEFCLVILACDPEQARLTDLGLENDHNVRKLKKTYKNPEDLKKAYGLVFDLLFEDQ